MKADWDLLFRNSSVPLKEGSAERGRVEEGLTSRERLNCVRILGHFSTKDSYLRDWKLEMGKVYARNGQMHML